MSAGFGKVIALCAGRIATIAAALACLGAAPGSSLSSSGVLKVRFGGDRNQTRVVVELDRATRGQLLAEGAGKLVQLSLADAAPDAPLDGPGQGLVRSWSVRDLGGSARLDLALVSSAQVVRRFELPPADGNPNYRYVIDLAATGPVTAVVTAAPTAPTARPGVPARAQQAADIIPTHAKKVVVIDAGHGGKDPGALGDDAREKDLTLAAAKALKQRLERDGRYAVVLTREHDEFVPLGQRVQVARGADADLFISLHADAGADPLVRGATVYTLSDKGSDRVAQRAINNNNDWFINVAMPSHDKAVNQILLDLTQRATKNQSSAFAGTLVEHVASQTQLVQRSHRDAGYVVLLAPDVPAVLLEMGFITNHQDETALEDAARRIRLMDAVGDAIDDYFAQQQERLASR
jgi:N-acetylmuramoyl-L-alanine amidase